MTEHTCTHACTHAPTHPHTSTQISLPTFAFPVDSGSTIQTSVYSCFGYYDDAFKSKQHVQNSLHIFPYLLPFLVCLPVCSLIFLFIPLFIVVFIEYFLCIKSCCCMHISENSWQVQSSKEIFRESGDLHAAYKLAVWDGMRRAKSWCYWDRIKEQREHPILTWVSGKAS